MTVVFLIVPIIDIFTFNDRKKANWYYTFIFDSEYWNNTNVYRNRTLINCAIWNMIKYMIWYREF